MLETNNLAYIAIGIALEEALIKPLLKRAFNSIVLTIVPPVIVALAPVMPDLIKSKTEEELRQLVAKELLGMADLKGVWIPRWSVGFFVRQFERLYSPFKNAQLTWADQEVATKQG